MIYLLAKVPSTLLVTFTTAAGFVLAAGWQAQRLLVTVAGTMLAVAAASALNQVQEASIDARMTRTAGRPIPRGRIAQGPAMLVATVLAILGFATLASLGEGGVAAMALAGLALAWYNAVYTPLKRVTAFASVPGAVVGAIPPLIGWVAAGGALWDPRIWAVAGFFFVWQVPHVWLVLLRNQSDYRQAGLPVLTRRLTRAQVGRLTFALVVASAAGGVVAASLAGIRDPVPAVLSVASAVVVLQCRGLLGSMEDAGLRRAQISLNLFGLLFTLAVIGAGAL